jgi:addiction module HigA family antidote
MSVVEAARHLKVSRQTMHRILAEKAAVTPEMAVRLGKFCGNGPGLWLRMQQAHDLWHVEQDLQELIEEIPTFKSAA